MSWEIVGLIVLIVIIIMGVNACNLSGDVKEVCEGWDKHDASIWDEYIRCFNHSIVNDTYTITAQQDFLR